MENNKNKEKCCICLDNLTKTNIVTFDCKHSIHLNCYVNCLTNNMIDCPLCKRKIKQNVPLYNHFNIKFIRIIRTMKRTTK